MKLNKQLLLYIVLSIVSYIVFYDFFDMKSYETSQKDIVQLNNKLWEDKTKLYVAHIDYNSLWIKEQKQNDKKQKVFKGKCHISKQGSLICIDKECFNLLAIVKKNGINYATFYAESFPANHIEMFAKNTFLYKDIVIFDITNDSISLYKKDTQQSWKFFLFDVNISKYKPKDSNETYL